MIPFLSARFSGSNFDGVVPPDVLDFPRTTLHTNFKISASGETLFLHDPSGVFVDSLRVYDLPPNVSIGIPSNGGDPLLFDNTTPGQRNPDAGFTGIITESVVFSQPGGPSDQLTLSLSGATGANQIRYTLNANEPTEFSPVYTTPLSINATTVVRAAIFQPNFLPSPVQSESYLFGAFHTLPIVSLVTEPDNFFHPVTGMYVLGEGFEGNVPYFGSNIWKEIEHPISLTFYEPGGGSSYKTRGRS